MVPHGDGGKERANTITGSSNIDKLRGILIAYGSCSCEYTGNQCIKFNAIEPNHSFNSNKLFSYNFQDYYSLL